MSVLRAILSPLWQGLGAQLRSPVGIWGHLVGHLMAVTNAKPNGLAIAALNLGGEESLLDLGCGSGHALARLHSRAPKARLVGLDWSATMLAQVRRLNRRAIAQSQSSPPQIQLVRGDFGCLPLKDRSFDAVLATNVAYFMENAEALREARRVLKPGGRLVIYATDRSAMRAWPFASRHTHRLITRERLTAMLETAGFVGPFVRIDDVDAGFGVKGLLARAEKQKTLEPFVPQEGRPYLRPLSKQEGGDQDGGKTAAQ